MGMEFEEIILGIEKEFKISITDEEAEDIYELNLGGLWNFIFQKISGRIVVPGVCLSSRVFYKMRRAMVESLGMRRNSISPRNELEEMFPEYIRTFQWERLSSETGLRLPMLQCPRSTEEYIHATSWGMLLSGLFSIVLFDKLMLIPASLILGSFFNYYVNEPKMIEDKTIHFPNKIKTLRDLVMATVDMNLAKFAKEVQIFTETENKRPGYRSWKQLKRFTGKETDETWERLCNVVIEVTGFDREFLTSDVTIKEICY